MMEKGRNMWDANCFFPSPSFYYIHCSEAWHSFQTHTFHCRQSLKNTRRSSFVVKVAILDWRKIIAADYIEEHNFVEIIVENMDVVSNLWIVCNFNGTFSKFLKILCNFSTEKTLKLRCSLIPNQNCIFCSFFHVLKTKGTYFSKFIFFSTKKKQKLQFGRRAHQWELNGGPKSLNI